MPETRSLAEIVDRRSPGDIDWIQLMGDLADWLES
jgi:hypothetical protein